MPSAKQIAWRKKFAKMSKAGVFRSTKKGKARAKETAEYLGNIRRVREADEKYAKSLKKSKQLSQKERSKMIQTKRKEVYGDKRGMEQAELASLNRTIPQFEMVYLSKQSQKILDSMKKRRDILRKK